MVIIILFYNGISFKEAKRGKCSIKYSYISLLIYHFFLFLWISFIIWHNFLFLFFSFGKTGILSRPHSYQTGVLSLELCLQSFCLFVESLAFCLGPASTILLPQPPTQVGLQAGTTMSSLFVEMDGSLTFCSGVPPTAILLISAYRPAEFPELPYLDLEFLIP